MELDWVPLAPERVLEVSYTLRSGSSTAFSGTTPGPCTRRLAY
jgi:hypothetical protein